MNRIILALAGLSCCAVLSAQTIQYKGTAVELGPRALYVDGSLSAADAARSPYIFNDFREAMSHIQDGTRQEPMRIYIAPWVYWVDDPDDGQIRRAERGGTPFGMVVRCESLQLLGMTGRARDVILASARGQTQGAVGNFTMFDFWGDDLVVKDLTMGNYCDIDLVYPLRPELGRKAKYSAITQAQVSFCHGDRIYAENVRFEARLNLSPLSGSKRVLFKNCHMESTDDSLNRCGVYLHCDLDFWGRQPFGSVDTYGTVFMDCDFNICHDEAVQAVSKGVGRHSLIDVRYHTAGRPVSLAWTFRPEEWLRCYQYNISLDGQPAFVGAAKPYNTVLLDQKAQLAAYRLVEDDGTVLYNTWNLLRGEDDWDPEGIRDRVEALSKRDGRDYGRIPTCLDLSARELTLQTGEEPAVLTADVFRHLGYKLNNQRVSWKVQPGFERFVRLSPDGGTCVVTPENHEDRTQTFDLIASTEEGLEGAVLVTVLPDFVEAPVLTQAPVLTLSGGAASVTYAIDLQGRADESLVTWYRCDDRKGNGAIPVAVSRGGKPCTSYALSRDDVGHYLAAGVAPKHLRCLPGEEVRVVSKAPVKASQVRGGRTLRTDFSDFPTDNQPLVKAGYWTVDAYKPADTAEYDWSVDPARPCWTWGTGINGAKGVGIQQLQQGARLRYTPLPGQYGDMSVTWQVDPAKDGGQGFASARMQYLDLFIKFDTRTLTGYALRVIRTVKFSDAVDIQLVKYEKGVVTPLTEGVSTNCFLTGCILSVKAEGNRLTAHVEGPNHMATCADDPRIHPTVDLEAAITPNAFGGIGLQHTSTVGTESRILVHSVLAEWK
ncbi:MAG: hypothetical protein K5849_02490 [Bacteroidales bacterium]|nr:hypothetical protein [Bacteroidales bacterium]